MAGPLEGGLAAQSASPDCSVVLSLDDERARDADLVGGKAACLAVARASGLPALRGFVLTIEAFDGRDAAEAAEVARGAWSNLSRDGSVALVVRSSSAAEDTAESSMAGRFTTVVGVEGWDAFVDAVDRVVASSRDVLVPGTGTRRASMAILVQPLIEPRVGGVMFGIDPVSGRSDRRVIAAVAGLPDRLVSGLVDGSRYEIDAKGRTVSHDPGEDHVRITRRTRRRLVGLGDRCAQLFGSHQDIEWAIDESGRLTLLQSRPVTTRVAGSPVGPVLGPGPTAETFPDPLSQLEQDLWVEPLRAALRSVFEILGVVSKARIDRSPLAVAVGGRVAVDLDLLEAGRSAPWYAVARRARSLRAAWTIGRLRGALVGLSEEVMRQADRALVDVPGPWDLTDRQLIASLRQFRVALESLHTYEMLVGLVLHPEGARLTGSSVALRVLKRARAAGTGDSEIPLLHPVVMVLVPPRIGPVLRLPREIAVPAWSPGPEDPAGLVREALRLRVRWTQEVSARFAWELGSRLAERGDLDRPEQVRALDIDTLELVVRGLAATVPPLVPETAAASDPLPARFRLSDRGIPVPVLDRAAHQGTGAGGGRGEGVVHIGAVDVPDGAVLVVRNLDSRLAPLLPRLGGLVAETGSVLAHLAILARESGVPVVVGLEGATSRWAEGSSVTVDGTTGEVTVVAGPTVGGTASSSGTAKGAAT